MTGALLLASVAALVGVVAFCGSAGTGIGGGGMNSGPRVPQAVSSTLQAIRSGAAQARACESEGENERRIDGQPENEKW